MPIYEYTAISQDGKKIKGQTYADSDGDLKVNLRDEGYFVQKVRLIKKKKAFSAGFLTSGRVSRREMVSFCRQFAILIRSKVKIIDALETLRHQKFSPYFCKVINDIHESVLKGESLSDSFNTYDKVFPAFFLEMLAIGEKSGSLDVVLDKVATYLERDAATRRKVRGAMIYPSFLIVMILVLVIFLVNNIIPEFSGVLNSFGSELPGITVAMLSISSFFTSYSFIIIPAILVFIIGVIVFLKTRTGRLVKDELNMHLPGIKNVTYNVITTRFCTAFSIMVFAGMPILDAMELLVQILNNEVLERRFKVAIEDVKQGRKIADSVDRCKIFPPMLISMLSVGEDTGSIPETLDKVADYYQGEMDYSIQKATALIEPIIIIVLGFIVLLVILSILLPILAIDQSIK